MEYLIVWAEIDEFGMIFRMEHDWMVVINIGMRLVCMITLCLVDET